MKRSRIRVRIGLLCALALLPLGVSACGGGGGGGGNGNGNGGGDLEATFTADPVGGSAGDVSMKAGSSNAEDFDVHVVVQGPLANLFGVAFRVQVPNDIRLLGRTTTNSILLQDAPDSTIFDASQVQAGDEVLVTATRVQPAAGFDNGVDVPPGGSSNVITLRFRALDATSGDLQVTDEELRACDDAAQTCTAQLVTFTGGSVVAN